MNPDVLREYEARLLEMREALQSLESIRQSGAAIVELDQTRTGRLSRMDALQLQAMANVNRERAALELRRIEATLRRIDDGTFGECVDCGESIAEARLRAQPIATLCVSCAESRERQQ